MRLKPYHRAISISHQKDEIRQPTTNIAALIRHAELAKSPLSKYVFALAQEIGLSRNRATEMGDIKDETRAWQKAGGKYEGHIDLVCDFCRGRLLIDENAHIWALRGIFNAGKGSHNFHESWKNRGIEVVEFEDFFLNPNKRGFRAINMKLRIDLGKGRYHICELQISHRGMERNYYSKSHELFEDIRRIEDTAKGADRELSYGERECISDKMHEIINLHEIGAKKYGLHSLQRDPTEKPALLSDNNNRYCLKPD